MFAVFIFLVVLSVLVLVHEFGHYIAARLCGVKAEEFGYGFPPRITGWKKWGTLWSINWLPLGGFVRLKGEQGEDGHDPDSFLSKNAFQRLFILSAGVLMNWLLAITIFSAGFMVGVPAQTEGLPASAIVTEKEVQVSEILRGSAAERAGLQVGDFLVAVDGNLTATVNEAKNALAAAADQQRVLTLNVKRDNQTLTLSATPQYVEDLGRAGLGVALNDTGIVRFPIPQAIVQGIGVTYAYTKFIVLALAGLIRDLFVERQLSADVSGPVGIAVMSGQIARQGAWPLLSFMGILSINLAVINFLPIPALDGGRAFFILIESLRRKRNNPRFEAALHQIGFITLLVLILLVTIRDLSHFGGIIMNGLRSFVGL
jgi:regulator of sigma E protease